MASQGSGDLMAPSAVSQPRAIPAGRRVAGAVRPPPSKSVTHRACNLALLAGRPVTLVRPLVAEDSELFLAALAALGFTVERVEDRVALAPPRAWPTAASLFCGNAGTMLRFLLAALATLPGRWTLDGTLRLRERPIGALAEALAALGARFEWAARPGFVPVTVHGGTLAGGAVRLAAAESSQFLSALLMAGTRAAAPIDVTVEGLVSAPYVELTLQLLAERGGRVERPAADRFRILPGPLAGGELEIEGDWSAACYPAAAAALAGGSVKILGLRPDSRQGDRGFLDLLRAMGAGVAPVGDGIEVVAGALVGIEADLSNLPDQVPTLAALAPFARGTTRIRHVPHLRLKESDRLAVMARELARLGVAVEEQPDGLTIPGCWAPPAVPPSTAAICDPEGDHRIAMSLALVGLRRPGVAIANPAVVAKSYPDFWRDFESLLAT